MKYLLFDLTLHKGVEFIPTNILASGNIVRIKNINYRIQDIIVKPANDLIVIQAEQINIIPGF